MKRENINRGVQISSYLDGLESQREGLNKVKSVTISIDSGYGMVQLSGEVHNIVVQLAKNAIDNQISELSAQLEAL